MSTAPEAQTTSTSNLDARRKRARRIIGVVTTAAIAVGGGAVAAKELKSGEGRQDGHSRVTPAATPSHTASPTEKSTENAIKTIEQLPGYGKQVSEQQRKMLRASSVEIITSQKDTADPYTTVSFCTGVKVNVGGQNYVATARHCFVDGPEIADVYPSNSSAGRAHDPSLTQPKDITKSVKQLRKEVSVYTLGANGNADMESGVTASSITASFYPDMALLKLDDSSPSATKFNALPSVAYESLLGGEAEPGAQAVIYSAPMSTGQRMIETRGTYLGITPDPGDEATNLAWVAINGQDADKDGCYLGGSGSAAYIAGAGLTGPLHGRNHPGDEFAVGGEKSRRAEILSQLGVDLGPNDTTLCGFSVVTPDIADNMAQVASVS